MTQLQYLPEVTTVVPDYDNKAFRVYFKDDKDPLSLNFSNYLLWATLRDENLAEYVVNNHASSSFTEMIGDLYEIGFPIDQKVVEFFADMESKVDPAILKFLDFLRSGFSNPQGDDVTDL